MAYHLAISVYGPGTDPNHRSHWGFLIYKPEENVGDLLHTPVVDLARLWYQFEERSGVPVMSKQSAGRFKIATITENQRQAAKLIIKAEPPPRDGKRKCQDWVLDTVVTLEVEELVEAGTAERIGSFVGKPAAEIAEMVGEDWIAANA